MNTFQTLRALAVGAAISLGAHPSWAADEDKRLEFFFGTCVNNTPRYLEKLSAAADVMDWKPLDGAAATMMAPADPDAAFSGWMAEWNGVLFFVGASEGLSEGKPFKTCAIAARHTMPESTAKLLGEQMKLEVLADEREAGQRYQLWNSEFSGTPVMLMLTSVTDGQPAVTLGILLREE